MDISLEQLREQREQEAERRLSLHAVIILAGALSNDGDSCSDANIAWAVGVAKKVIIEAGKQA